MFVRTSGLSFFCHKRHSITKDWSSHDQNQLDTSCRPVMHHFFLERFLQPADWFEKRLAYTRSVAASSMVSIFYFFCHWYKLLSLIKHTSYLCNSACIFLSQTLFLFIFSGITWNSITWNIPWCLFQREEQMKYWFNAYFVNYFQEWPCWVFSERWLKCQRYFYCNSC